MASALRMRARQFPPRWTPIWRDNDLRIDLNPNIGAFADGFARGRRSPENIDSVAFVLVATLKRKNANGPHPQLILRVGEVQIGAADGPIVPLLGRESGAPPPPPNYPYGDSGKLLTSFHRKHISATMALRCWAVGAAGVWGARNSGRPLSISRIIECVGHIESAQSRPHPATPIPPYEADES